MAALLGKWEYVSAENLDAYMQASGVPENLRAMAKNSRPVLEVSQDGDSWTFKTTVGEKVKDTTFKLGEDFETTSLIGLPIKCNIVVNGDKMVEKQRTGDFEVIITREVSGEDLISVMSFSGTSATIKFKRA